MNHMLPFLTTVTVNGLPQATESGGGHIIFAVICLLIGIFNIAFPYEAWYLSHGWYYKDAEPSDFALTMARISGVIAVIIGIVFFFI